MAEIIINAPSLGIAQSPHVGYGDVRQLDIHTVPGVVRLNNGNILVSSTTITSKIKWMISDPVNSTNVYAIDSAGKVYNSTDYGSTWAVLGGNSTSTGEGLCIWKDFLVSANATTLDFYGPLTGSSGASMTAATPGVVTDTAHGLSNNDTIIFSSIGTVTNIAINTVYYVINKAADTFQISLTQGGAAINTTGTGSAVTYRGWHKGYAAFTIASDTDWHPMMVSKNDDHLYGGAGRYGFRLEETVGDTFDPGDSTSYTFEDQAVTLPAAYKIKCLDELGSLIYLGTWQGTTIKDIQIADIFPWDGESTAPSQPIVINEHGIHAIKNMGGSLVVLAGVNGRIYRSDGSSANLIAKLPIDLSGTKYIEFFPGAICVYKGRILFGIGDAATTTDRIGVYSLLQTGQGSILNMEYINSYGTDGSTAINCEISALCPAQYTALLFAFTSNTTYGIDYISPNSYKFYSDGATTEATYAGYFESPMYIIGDSLRQRKITEMEFQLARPLRTGEGIKFEYRKDLTASYTAIRTFAYADTDVGAVTSKNITTMLPNDILAAEQIQFKISLTGNTSGTNTTPELKRIILK